MQQRPTYRPSLRFIRSGLFEGAISGGGPLGAGVSSAPPLPHPARTPRTMAANPVSAMSLLMALIERGWIPVRKVEVWAEEVRVATPSVVPSSRSTPIKTQRVRARVSLSIRQGTIAPELGGGISKAVVCSTAVQIPTVCVVRICSTPLTVHTRATASRWWDVGARSIHIDAEQIRTDVGNPSDCSLSEHRPEGWKTARGGDRSATPSIEQTVH